MQIFKSFCFIPKKRIEKQATAILQQMAKTPNYQLKFPLDASRVAEFLGLDVVWDSIPDDEKGMIAARILPLEKLIEINEMIPKLRGGFGESTIAHEVGHWVLHINQKVVENYLMLPGKHKKNIKVEPLLCRNELNLSGIEWQAQYFSSCLLMPQFKLKEVCQGRNLKQWRELYHIASELGVTISNLIHRLKDVGWIELTENSREIEVIKF
ncbi:ImmA/IrrE family metallo-endopeptidase [Crocosphaera sp. XPORK-15E]|uniref:ImmA/IrrE family metallo-endopeptidase n=1 Tax=Crocosphaera sp. XPORK-15E TaxID=3110247 RepID=UPI002B20B47B|nr:ImmA/IrrE family metallo-endopeptidase [Crocosphaera sp. XPORK-15E]MEA5533492.1 ImmA/IrrE family metallo-endopeptidase [Crocosphaera sp. XPORK-15E]